MSLQIDFAHALTVQEARERIRAFGDYLHHKHGIDVTWTSDDQAVVKGRYLVVAIQGTMTVQADMVRFEGKDPGFLWRGKTRDYLHYKLGRYLDPKTAVSDLPRR